MPVFGASIVPNTKPRYQCSLMPHKRPKVVSSSFNLRSQLRGYVFGLTFEKLAPAPFCQGIFPTLEVDVVAPGRASALFLESHMLRRSQFSEAEWLRLRCYRKWQFRPLGKWQPLRRQKCDQS